MKSILLNRNTLCTMIAFALSSNIYAQQNDTGEAEARVLEEVIITAQKREQTLQEVPVTVSAFSGDFVEEAGVQDIRDIAGLTPNLSIKTRSETEATVFIRGIGSLAPGIGADPAVGRAAAAVLGGCCWARFQHLDPAPPRWAGLVERRGGAEGESSRDRLLSAQCPDAPVDLQAAAGGRGSGMGTARLRRRRGVPGRPGLGKPEAALESSQDLGGPDGLLAVGRRRRRNADSVGGTRRLRTALCLGREPRCGPRCGASRVDADETR